MPITTKNTGTRKEAIGSIRGSPQSPRPHEIAIMEVLRTRARRQTPRRQRRQANRTSHPRQGQAEAPGRSPAEHLRQLKLRRKKEETGRNIHAKRLGIPMKKISLTSRQPRRRWRRTKARRRGSAAATEGGTTASMISPSTLIDDCGAHDGCALQSSVHSAAEILHARGP